MNKSKSDLQSQVGDGPGSNAPALPTPTKKRKAGQPAKITAFEKQLILKMATFGLTDEQLAEALGITQQTINNTKRRDPKFFESLKESKSLSDKLVQKSLYRRALGYEYEEEVATKEGPVLCKKVMHPDVTACIFWLKNRQPEAWRDKHDVDFGKDVNNAAASISQLFRKRYEKEAPRLASGENPAVVLFNRLSSGNGNGNGNGQH